MKYYTFSNLGERGFTIIEIVVVTGLILISVLASLSMTNEFNKSNRKIASQMTFNSISSLLREILRYNSTCNSALVGVGLNNSGFNAPGPIINNMRDIQMLAPGVLQDGNPNDDIIAVGTQIQHLDVNTLRLINAVDLGGGKYFSQVQLGVTERLTGLQLKPINLGGLYFSTTAGAISSCDNLADATPLCVEMGCTWNPLAVPMCQCTPIDLSCPPQQFLTGVDTNGGALCTPLGNGPCPGGTYLRGVSIGLSDCAPLPP